MSAQDLALRGLFRDIEFQFDKKKADKAQEYVMIYSSWSILAFNVLVQ